MTLNYKILNNVLMLPKSRLKAQEQTSCCYSRSDKYWITDPQGIAWESFHSLGDIPTLMKKNR